MLVKNSKKSGQTQSTIKKVQIQGLGIRIGVHCMVLVSLTTYFSYGKSRIKLAVVTHRAVAEKCTRVEGLRTLLPIKLLIIV